MRSYGIDELLELEAAAAGDELEAAATAAAAMSAEAERSRRRLDTSVPHRRVRGGLLFPVVLAASLEPAAPLEFCRSRSAARAATPLALAQLAARSTTRSPRTRPPSSAAGGGGAAVAAPSC